MLLDNINAFLTLLWVQFLRTLSGVKLPGMHSKHHHRNSYSPLLILGFACFFSSFNITDGIFLLHNVHHHRAPYSPLLILAFACFLSNFTISNGNLSRFMEKIVQFAIGQYRQRESGYTPLCSNFLFRIFFKFKI